MDKPEFTEGAFIDLGIRKGENDEVVFDRHILNDLDWKETLGSWYALVGDYQVEYLSGDNVAVRHIPKLER